MITNNRDLGTRCFPQHLITYTAEVAFVYPAIPRGEDPPLFLIINLPMPVSMSIQVDQLLRYRNAVSQRIRLLQRLRHDDDSVTEEQRRAVLFDVTS